ncbi:hypothetical protein [Paracoccus marcusii]|uniref:hypothetical protein n=1 Tax=Paracoccus marcusii TaxID=59779 RepID=UPI003735E613
MKRISSEKTFVLSLSQKDWTLIETALTAYDHNAIYRDLRDNLDMQVAMLRALHGVQTSGAANVRRNASKRG